MTPPTGQPCPCWTARTTWEHGHDGHCCFRHYDGDVNRVTCGHDDEGMRRAAAGRLDLGGTA